MIIKFNPLLAIFLITVFYASSTAAANISILERDRKGDLVFIHEYYGFYDEKEQKIRKRSYLEVLSAEKGSLYVMENSPLFTHLAWFAEENILVALSTITAGNNPQIVLYSRAGKELGRKRISCEASYTQSGAKCYLDGRNIHWFEKENAPALYLKVGKQKESDISVCLGQYCYEDFK